MPRHDPHSYADDAQPVADFLIWRARVDFASHTIRADATLRFREAAGAGPLDLDTRDLTIATVQDEARRPLEFDLAPPEPILGARLRIQLHDGARDVLVLPPAFPYGGMETPRLTFLSPSVIVRRSLARRSRRARAGAFVDGQPRFKRECPTGGLRKS